MQSRPEIQSHTAIRGIAAFLVVAYHLQFDGGLLAFETATDFFKRSYLFVDLFFILSGFIISYVSQADRDEPLSRDAVSRFMKKRLIRLYPLVLFCLFYLLIFRVAISIAFVALSSPPPFNWGTESLIVLLGQFTLTNAWLPYPSEWNIPSWSISAEVFAYLMFPILILCKSLRPRITWIACAGIVIGFYTAAVRHGDLDITLVWSPFRGLAGFLLGVAIYLLRGSINRVPVSVLSIMQIVSIVGIGATLMLPVNDVVVIPAFMVLVATTWTDKGMIARVLKTGVATTLGHWSYSIYLNHLPVIGIIGFFWSRLASRLGIDGDAARIAWIVLVYAVVLIVSRWTYIHIEIKAQRYLTRRFLAAPATILALPTERIDMAPERARI